MAVVLPLPSLIRVLNFPRGHATVFDDVRHDLDRALVAGAHEIDVVFPYRYYLGDGEDVQDDDDDASTRPARCKQFLMDIVTAVHRAHALVKVILETAAFPTTASITAASRLAITAGVDFLKTSTGFHPKGGATHDAVHAMLEAVRESGAQAHVGIKVSGGVRSVEQARGYLRQVQHVYSEGAVPLMTARHFRIGTSALFHVLLRAGKGGDESAAVKGYAVVRKAYLISLLLLISTCNFSHRSY